MNAVVQFDDENHVTEPLMPLVSATLGKHGDALARLALHRSPLLKQELTVLHDERMHQGMLEVTRHLSLVVNVDHAHLQGEVIIFNWDLSDIRVRLPRERELVASRLVSYASCCLLRFLAREYPTLAAFNFYFEGDIREYPDRTSLVDAIVRHRSAMNADHLRNYGRIHLGQGKLSGPPSHWRATLHSHGLNWKHMPRGYREGVHLRRVDREVRQYSDEQLAQLPPDHPAHGQPQATVLRRMAEFINLPPLHQLENVEEVLFEAAVPKRRYSDRSNLASLPSVSTEVE